MKTSYIDTFSDVPSGTGSTIRTHALNVPDADLAAETDADLARWLLKTTDPATLAAQAAAFEAAHALPRYMNPGDPPQSDAKGGVVRIDKTGAVFRNGVRLSGGSFWAQVLIYGDDIFAKSLNTVPVWNRWIGTYWGPLTATSLDTTIFI